MYLTCTTRTLERQFISRLSVGYQAETKANSYEFGTLKDTLIRDRVVCGISSDITQT